MVDQKRLFQSLKAHHLADTVYELGNISSLMDLIHQMLQLDPALRITATNI